MIKKTFNELKVGEVITHPSWCTEKFYIIEDIYYEDKIKYCSLKRLSDGWKYKKYNITNKDFEFNVFKSIKHWQASLL